MTDNGSKQMVSLEQELLNKALFQAKDTGHELNKPWSSAAHNDEINMHTAMVFQRDFSELQFSSYYKGRESVLS